MPSFEHSKHHFSQHEHQETLPLPTLPNPLILIPRNPAPAPNPLPLKPPHSLDPKTYPLTPTPSYLFADILYTYIPNVFQTHYQSSPLDLFTDAFYPSRLSLINHRLALIANGGAEALLLETHALHAAQATCIVGLDWSFALEDLVQVVHCFRGEALATVCLVMAQEYQQRGGGIPDLFLWRLGAEGGREGEGGGKGERGGEVMFVEVKSENDRLSDTQRLWIDVLTGAGIKVELANAVAREVRKL